MRFFTSCATLSASRCEVPRRRGNATITREESNPSVSWLVGCPFFESKIHEILDKKAKRFLEEIKNSEESFIVHKHYFIYSSSLWEVFSQNKYIVVENNKRRSLVTHHQPHSLRWRVLLGWSWHGKGESIGRWWCPNEKLT